MGFAYEVVWIGVKDAKVIIVNINFAFGETNNSNANELKKNDWNMRRKRVNEECEFYSRMRIGEES